MAGKERENFQRQSILVVDYIKDGFKDLLNLDITKKYTSFENFINTNQHELYHLCYYKSKCCQCPKGFILPPKRVLHPVQLNQLLDQTGPKHSSHRSGTCCSLAKSNLSLDVLDVTLARFLLKGFCSLGPSIEKATEILLGIRNHVYGHTKEARISDAEFTINWTKTETALIEIARFCGNENQTKQKLDDLKNKSLDETSLLRYQTRILEEIQRDNELKEYAEVLTSKVEGLEATVEGLGTKLEGFEATVEGCGTKLEGLEAAVEGYGTKLEGYGTKLEGFEATVEGYGTKVERFEATVEGYGTKLDGFGAAVGGYRTKLEGFEATVEGYGTKLEGFEATVEGYGTKLERVEATVQGCGTKLESAIEEMKNKRKTENEEKRGKCEEISAALIEQHTNRAMFVPTSGLTAALKSLEESGIVVLVGPPGSGKSTTAIELLRQYQCKQYVCLYLNDVTEFPNIVTLGEKYIVLCDDIFGKTNCKYNPDIHSSLLNILDSYVKAGNIKIIMTIRESIWQLIKTEKLLLNRRIVSLGSEFEMSISERKTCLIKHCYGNAIDVVGEIPTKICQKTRYITNNAIKEIINLKSSPLLGFPQACTLFTSNIDFFNQGLSFFKNVNTVLLSCISDMRKEGVNKRSLRVDYTLLVYVLKNNCIMDISTFDIEKFNETCTSIYSDQDGGLNHYDIGDSIDRLTGIYLKKRDTNGLTFHHRVIFEAVLLSCKSMKKDILITFMDLEFIVEFIRPENYVIGENEVFLVLNRRDYNILADRVIDLLVSSNDWYRFIKELMVSSLIKEFGRELISLLIEIYNKHPRNFESSTRLHVVLVEKQFFAIGGFDFDTACLLFCNNNNDLISYLVSVISDKKEAIITCFLISCIQTNESKAKTLVYMLKRCDTDQLKIFWIEMIIRRVLQMPYLYFLHYILYDHRHEGSEVVTELLALAAEAKSKIRHLSV